MLLHHAQLTLACSSSPFLSSSQTWNPFDTISKQFASNMVWLIIRSGSSRPSICSWFEQWQAQTPVHVCSGLDANQARSPPGLYNGPVPPLLAWFRGYFLRHFTRPCFHAFNRHPAKPAFEFVRDRARSLFVSDAMTIVGSTLSRATH